MKTGKIDSESLDDGKFLCPYFTYCYENFHFVRGIKLSNLCMTGLQRNSHEHNSPFL